MANNLSSNPVVVDTSSGSALDTVNRAVTAIMATGLTTAAHTAVVQDSAGNPFWETIAATTNYASPVAVFNPPAELGGLKVPTLSSGKVYIWYK